MTSAPRPYRVMVGTPAYGGMVHIDYMRALFELGAAGVPFQLATIGNESLITRARNSILAKFHVQTDCTHLLFLDADVHLPAADLIRMLEADVPVLGAPVALKGFDADGNRIWNIGRSLGAQGRLIKVSQIGTAALLLRRDACLALIEDAIAHGHTYTPNLPGDRQFDTDVHFDVFRTGVHEGVYLSEDFWACRRLRALGFDVLIDPTVITTHHGTMAV